MMYIAASLPSRLRGLLLREDFDGEMMICPCRSVHTFGMGECIDVAFLDRYGKVLKSVRQMTPFGVCSQKGACAVVERIAKPEHPWYQPGDKVDLLSVRESSFERSAV